jgi:metal-responsive CopG/Arc/MetJ family transcriptional regulator
MMMRTTVSIPASLLHAADRAAKRLAISRDEIFVRAIREYLSDHARYGVTERLNEVYAESTSSIDPVNWKMQGLSLSEEW